MQEAPFKRRTDQSKEEGLAEYIYRIIAFGLVLLGAAASAAAQNASGTIKRLYVIEYGQGSTADRENWRVPLFNVDRAKSLTSMERIAQFLACHKAQLWIHHDRLLSDGQKKSPAHYE